MTETFQETYSRAMLTLPRVAGFSFWDAERLQAKTRKFLPKTETVSFKDIVARPDETAGSERSLHFLPIPIAYSLIRPAWNVIRQTKNQVVAAESRKMLLTIQDTIIDFQHLKFDLGYLPQLQAFNVDDGSVLIEWIFNDFRIGFSIESEAKDSSWYLVSNTNSEEIAASGYISRVEVKILAFWLINFAIFHS